MVPNAYAFFFAAVLIGSLMLLEYLVRAHGRHVVAALRGELGEPCFARSARPRLTRVRSGRRLALPHVVFNNCRL